ncbi:MAG: protein-(glutamine-N5) methyltransferase, release factor-specific [Betaproteobacteria bacterium RIFCSPLOWO2_02_FULL_66_14]|nr:MAG: protein-(glutamine-N5) methyltransferase, release factor-specific [Betaproteobacteria bacterium RIFCSPLOWO2_02_FULL_66_14]
MKLAAAIASAGIEPREARLLLAAVCRMPVASVLAHPERELTAEETDRFSALAARRRGGEPIAYLLGMREFYGLEFNVSPAVLIPRPETELLVELAIAWHPRRVLDLGTGCGAIALAIKHALPEAEVLAVDSSAAALQIARSNALRHGLEVEFRHGHWLDPVAGKRFDLIVSNPPYVAEGDQYLVQGDLRFEPRAALVAGREGLEAIREIAAQAAPYLLPGGWLCFEHGLGQDVAVRKLLYANGFEAVATWPDLAGIARASAGRVKSESINQVFRGRP